MNVCGAWNDPKEDPAAPILAAFEAGCRVFDHADIYAGGKCEQAYAEAVRREPELGRVGRVIAKFGHVFPAWDSGQPHHYNTRPEHLESVAEASLKRLGVETLDLMLIHRPDPLSDYAALAETAQRLRASGKVREFGVSNFNPNQADAARAAGWPVLANQFQFSALQADAVTNGTLDDALEHQVVPMAWASQERGLLGDRPLPDQLEPAEAERITAVREALDATDLPRDQAALAWIRTHPAGPLPVVGTTDPERIRSAWLAADRTLDPLDWYRVYLAAGYQLP